MKVRVFLVLFVLALWTVPSIASAQVSDEAAFMPGDVDFFVVVDVPKVRQSKVFGMAMKEAQKDKEAKKLIDESKKMGFDIEKDVQRVSVGSVLSAEKAIVVIESKVELAKVYAKLIADPKYKEEFKDVQVKKINGFDVYTSTSKEGVFAFDGKNMVASAKEDMIKAYLDSKKAGKKTLLANKKIIDGVKKCGTSAICAAGIMPKKVRDKLAKKDPVYQISKAQADGKIIKGEKFMASAVKMAVVSISLSGGVNIAVYGMMTDKAAAAAAVAVGNELLPKAEQAIQSAMPVLLPVLKNAKISHSGAEVTVKTQLSDAQVEAIGKEVPA